MTFALDTFIGENVLCREDVNTIVSSVWLNRQLTMCGRPSNVDTERSCVHLVTFQACRTGSLVASIFDIRDV